MSSLQFTVGKENSLDNQGSVNNDASIFVSGVFIKSLCATACGGLKKIPVLMGARILFFAIDFEILLEGMTIASMPVESVGAWSLILVKPLFFICLDFWLDMMMSITLQV